MPIMPEVTDQDGLAIFSVPFNPRWVESIKRLVPPRSREWRPESKRWAVHPIYRAVVIDLTRRVFGDIRIRDTNASSEPSQTNKAGEHFQALHLQESAPAALIEGAYRILARLHHPDVGGDGETMKRLNAARDALKCRVSA